MSLVLVWIARSAARVELVTDDERASAERFATEALRREHLTTRALARWALSQGSPGIHPLDWRFDRTPEGKPYVAGPDRRQRFNLSNCGALVACAIATCEVGVDVEVEARGAELLASAAGFFSPEERASIGARAGRAVELWTAKEAITKGLGHGISARPSRIDAASLAREHGWSIETRWLAGGVALSAAHEGPPRDVVVREAAIR